MGIYNGASTGIAANRGGDNDTSTATAYPITCAMGTFYGFDVIQDDDACWASVSNKTTGEQTFFSWKQDVSTTSTANGYFGCAGTFGMCMFGGDFAVTNYTVTMFAPKQIDVLIWGDSIAATGARASDFDHGWTAQIRQGLACLGLSTYIFGCGSDRSVESSNELAEALMLPKPTLLLYAAGGNDISAPVNTAYYQSNLPAIRSQFPSTQVVWVGPTARTNIDVSPLAYWMETNQPQAFIDAYTATKNPGYTNTLNLYTNSYDGVHLNNEGYVAVVQIVRQWLRQHGLFVP
jgi:lysophospholipase L1-like esterase